jgi:hypothetical protein
MKRNTIAYLIFAIGVFMLAVHTTLPVFWQLLGFAGTFPLSRPVPLYYASGITPILGVFLLLVAGLVSEKQETPR